MKSRSKTIIEAIDRLRKYFIDEGARRRVASPVRERRERLTLIFLMLAFVVSFIQSILTLVAISDGRVNSEHQDEATRDALSISRQAAEAATISANASKSLVEAAQMSASQAKISADAAVNANLINQAIERPKIVTTGILNEAEMIAGATFKYSISYANAGREAAFDFWDGAFSFFVPRPIVWDSETVLLTLKENLHRCKDRQLGSRSGSVYPGVSYFLQNNIDGSVISQDVVDQANITVVAGCFSHQSRKSRDYSYFCYAYDPKQNYSGSGHWVICPVNTEDLK